MKFNLSRFVRNHFTKDKETQLEHLTNLLKKILQD